MLEANGSADPPASGRLDGLECGVELRAQGLMLRGRDALVPPRERLETGTARSERAAQSDLMPEVPVIKLEVVRTQSLNRVFAAQMVAYALSAVGFGPIVWALGQADPPCDVSFAGQVGFVAMAGFGYTLGAIMLLWVAISYPQRVIVRALRGGDAMPLLPQQLLLLALVVVFMVVPVLSPYHAVHFWLGFSASVQAVQEDDSRCFLQDFRAIAGIAAERPSVLGSGGALGLACVVFIWGSVLRNSGNSTSAMVDAMRRDGQLDPSLERSNSSTDRQQSGDVASGERDPFLDTGEEAAASASELSDEEGGVHGMLAWSTCAKMAAAITAITCWTTLCTRPARERALRRAAAFRRNTPMRLLFVLVLYVASSMAVSIRFKFQPSLIPFVSAITLLKACTERDGQGFSYCSPASYPDTGFARSMASVGLFALELAGAALLLQLSRWTDRKVKQIPYDRNRSNFLAVLYFNSTLWLLWTWVVILSALELAVPPANVWIFQAVKVGGEVKTRLNPLYSVGITAVNPGMSLVYLIQMTWLLGTAFVYLPSDSVGVKGWFVGSGDTRETGAGARPTAYAGAGAGAGAGLLAGFLDEHPVYLAREADFAQLLAGRGAGPGKESVEEGRGGRKTRQKRPARQRGLLVHQSSVLRAIAADAPPPTSTFAEQLRAAVLVLETEVKLFNFASATYGLQSHEADTSEASARALERDCAEFTFLGHVKDDATDTHALLAYSTDRVVVAFRGTVSGVNVKTDLDYALRKYPFADRVAPVEDPSRSAMAKRAAAKPARVHAGFLRAYQNLSRQIALLVNPLILARHGETFSQHRALCTTGHSLGGGLAVLCAFEFGANLFLQLGHVGSVQCTTWASPRVGSYSFVERFRRVVPTARRFVLARDLIPRTPLRWMEGPYSGYMHVGLECLLDLQGNLVVSPNVAESTFVGKKRRAPVKRMHFMSRYCLALVLWVRRRHGSSWEPPFWLSTLNKMTRYCKGELRHCDPHLQRLVRDVLFGDGVVYAGKRTVATQTVESTICLEDGVESRHEEGPWVAGGGRV